MTPLSDLFGGGDSEMQIAPGAARGKATIIRADFDRGVSLSNFTGKRKATLEMEVEFPGTPPRTVTQKTTVPFLACQHLGRLDRELVLPAFEGADPDAVVIQW